MNSTNIDDYEEESTLSVALQFVGLLFGFFLIAFLFIGFIELLKKLIQHIRENRRQLTGQYFRNIVFLNIMHVFNGDGDDSGDDMDW
ncbi:hypothetical protein CAEBREN_11355 [Caenorhabditis brenneri]|uniref:Uncharacterized protein n=1 Tax=Caenorhabditis brenneri TaxID=135651 RepID=G0NSQ5_CAEBE|nr:hypothetical protein CAEBREN_11355 [Caenorhabditis brenneri]